jgi:hypothetical protein
MSIDQAGERRGGERGERKEDEPLRATRIRRHNDRILPVLNVLLHPPDHTRFRPQVIHRDLEEPLDLRGVKVHRDDVVAAGDLEHVGDELGGDGRAGLVFPVLLTEISVRRRERGRNGGGSVPCESRGSKG